MRENFLDFNIAFVSLREKEACFVAASEFHNGVLARLKRNKGAVLLLLECLEV